MSRCILALLCNLPIKCGKHCLKISLTFSNYLYLRNRFSTFPQFCKRFVVYAIIIRCSKAVQMFFHMSLQKNCSYRAESVVSSGPYGMQHFCKNVFISCLPLFYQFFIIELWRNYALQRGENRSKMYTNHHPKHLFC